MSNQSTLPTTKRTYKKKEKKSPAIIAREKLQEAQIANNEAMWKELLKDNFDVTQCLVFFEVAEQLQKVRDYIALNKCPI